LDLTPKTIAFRLRAATWEDGDFIYRLRVEGLKEFVAQIWGWDETFQHERFWTSFDPSRYQVIVVDNRDVGAISIEQRGHESFLADIEIAPEWRGKGLGTAVLRDFVVDAERRHQSAFLQVLKINPARRLYEQLGFQIVGETDTHYQMSTFGLPSDPT
jgi:ribosomal protein S18 acetylase RimI-like enzyme